MTPSGARLDHDWFDGPLPPNVHLGARSWLYSSFAFLHLRTRRPVVVGEDTGIYSGTMFDLGPEGEVSIGRYCTIVSPVFSTNARVAIGDHVLISHAVVIAGSEASLPGADGPSGDITIEDDCWIGANAVVVGPAHLGRGVVVGASAVVTGDVPAWSIVAGNPARIVGRTPEPAT